MEVQMNRKMLIGDPPVIHLTQNDVHRLDPLLAGLAGTSRTIDYLSREVERASIVADDHPLSFVKLGSRVFFQDEAEKLYTGNIAFPNDAAKHPDAISVLTPVGAALLGLGERESISYETLDGRTKTLTVLRLLPPS
jgi:regulator of nucleoside diphosphate kinase